MRWLTHGFTCPVTEKTKTSPKTVLHCSRVLSSTTACSPNLATPNDDRYACPTTIWYAHFFGLSANRVSHLQILWFKTSSVEPISTTISSIPPPSYKNIATGGSTVTKTNRLACSGHAFFSIFAPVLLNMRRMICGENWSWNWANPWKDWATCITTQLANCTASSRSATTIFSASSSYCTPRIGISLKHGSWSRGRSLTRQFAKRKS